MPFTWPFSSVHSVCFDSLAPARLALRANLWLLYLKGPAFSIVFKKFEKAGAVGQPGVYGLRVLRNCSMWNN